VIRTEISTIDVDGQLLRVGIKRGAGAPLLVFNGIGANLELLEPFTHALEGFETIVFDVPGVGGSAPSASPYRLRGLARLAERLLDRLGYHAPIDVLGLSWGGALAQQFAYTCRQRCRRLILVSTTPGSLMVPGSPFVLAKLFNPRRYNDPNYFHRIAPDIYGGDMRSDRTFIKAHSANLMRVDWLGYAYQQLAFCGWSSLAWLRTLKQPTLVLSGNDDPLVPLVNAHILAKLIPRARIQVIEDGHLFLMSSPHRVVPMISDFLAPPEPAF
jgi:poly(3-hydroxyalkanoate) depolymerase